MRTPPGHAGGPQWSFRREAAGRVSHFAASRRLRSGCRLGTRSSVAIDSRAGCVDPRPSRAAIALVRDVQHGDHVRVTERILREAYQAIIDAVAAADLDALDRLIDDDITDHNAVPGQVPGRAGIKYWVTMMHDAFADLPGVVEDTVVEGDKIAARVTWHGTHRGDFVGLKEPAYQ
jgi:predicted ester cyclase